MSKESEKLEQLIEEAARNTKKQDMVNHPSHYGGDTPYEVIKVLKAWMTPDEYRGFLKGNVIKYLARARLKGGAQDYEKAQFYQNELVAFEQELVQKEDDIHGV